MKKRDFLKLSSVATAGLAFGAAAPGAYAQSTAGTLRVAMTAADIPLTTGQPNQGAEGVRFMGITVYDGLTRWDLSKSDVAAKVVPDLAESWSISETDKRVWTFKLRRGVNFHDGSEFNADAVIWNLDKLLNGTRRSSMQRKRIRAACTAGGSRRGARSTTTRSKSPRRPSMPSCPTRSRASSCRVPPRTRNSGATGTSSPRIQREPGRGSSKLIPRERAELVRNTDYWDKTRIPKSIAWSCCRFPMRRTASPRCSQVRSIGWRRLRQTSSRGSSFRNPDRHEFLSAHLALLAQPPRRLAVPGHPRAQGDEPCH